MPNRIQTFFNPFISLSISPFYCFSADRNSVNVRTLSDSLSVEPTVVRCRDAITCPPNQHEVLRSQFWQKSISSASSKCSTVDGVLSSTCSLISLLPSIINIIVVILILKNNFYIKLFNPNGVNIKIVLFNFKLLLKTMFSFYLFCR